SMDRPRGCPYSFTASEPQLGPNQHTFVSAKWPSTWISQSRSLPKLSRVLWIKQALTARRTPVRCCSSRPGASTLMRKEPSRTGCTAFSAVTPTTRSLLGSPRVFKYSVLLGSPSMTLRNRESADRLMLENHARNFTELCGESAAYRRLLRV